MAFIPDEAIEDSYQPPAGAWRLYCLLCRRRDHRRGVANLRPHTGMGILKLNKSQFFAAQSWLKSNGWINKISDGEFELLKGSFTPIDSEKSESEKSESEKSESRLRKIGVQTPKNRTSNSEKSESRLKEYYPASLSSNLNPAHTSQHGAASVSADADRVPAIIADEENKHTQAEINSNGHKSRFSLDECLRYVELEIKNGEFVKNKRGLATHLWKTGESDLFIETAFAREKEWLEKNEEESFYVTKLIGMSTEEATRICDEFGYELRMVTSVDDLPKVEVENDWRFDRVNVLVNNDEIIDVIRIG